MNDLLVLSESDVRRALPMGIAIEAMREAFAALSSGEATVPLRTSMELPQGQALVMPAAWPEKNLTGLKLATVHPQNPAAGLPTVAAMVLVVRADNGQPVAVMGASALTAIRTGAGAGLATDLLARPNAKTCAIFGAGVQARTLLEAICCVRPIEHVVVFNRTRANARTFAREMNQQLGIRIDLADNPEQLLQANVIGTATSCKTPVFDAAHVGPGTHISAVGTHKPGESELPSGLVQKASVFVDHRATCAREAGDLLDAGVDVTALPEIGEVVLGAAPGRSCADEITLFKSVGNAVQDIGTAACIIAKAQQLGLGTSVPL